METMFEIEGLFRFLDESVSPFHAVAAAARLLEANGFVRLEESAPWQLTPGGRYYTTRNGSTCVAFRLPAERLTGWHITASHGDSPTWRIKSDWEDGFYAHVATEGYGGMIMSTWLDRPLTAAGRLLVRTEAGIESRLVAPRRALLCIPNLCIHFNKGVNDGQPLNAAVDLQPICGQVGSELMPALAAEAGVSPEEVLGSDLVLATLDRAQRVGVQGEYFMSGRIDDLECAYTTLWGFLQAEGKETGRCDVWAMFDNEEVGSSSRQGACGSCLPDTMARIAEHYGLTREECVCAEANSLLLSADNAHARHPNHPEKSDPRTPVRMGGGVVIKYNAKQTYTTSGLTGSAFEAICRAAGVPTQTFCNRPDLPGGRTLGNLLGHHVAVPMLDIGLGQLAMHSCVETASCADAAYMAQAVAKFYNTPIRQPRDGQWELGL